MNDRIAQLEAALHVNVALCVEAARLTAAYVSPKSDRTFIINETIRLFEGPATREAQRLTAEALGEAPDSTHYHWGGSAGCRCGQSLQGIDP